MIILFIDVYQNIHVNLWMFFCFPLIKKRRPDGLLYGGTRMIEKNQSKIFLVFKILFEDDERQD